jgi:hypothetical protein
MSRFSLGMGSIAGAGVVVLAVISTALARGPYGGPAPRRSADSDVTESPSATPARARVDVSAPKPLLSGAKTVASPGEATSTAPVVVPLPGADVRQLLVDFDKKGRMGDARGQLAVLEQLAELDKASFGEDELQKKIITLTQQLTLLPGNESDRAFNLLATKTGTHGLDIMLFLITNRSGTASTLASKLLENNEIIERGSPAMQIAYKLRKAKCEQKKALLPEAGEKGDRRTKGQLEELNQDCNSRAFRRRGPGACCLHKDPALMAAIAAMDARSSN